MNYKTTIAIPCYNKANYIERSLNSLINLSRFKEFEIIIVDDCSTDGSVDIIKKYSDMYANINLICFNKGSGSPSKPRNTAIEKSTADYIIFMDPDDVVINDGYSVLLTKMEEYQSDILIGTRIGINEAGARVFTDYICPPYINRGDQQIKLDLVKRRPFILKTIYRKKLILDNNISFNEKISTSEDECFDMQCVAYANKISKINDIVYQYTWEAEESLTTNISISIYEELYDVLSELYKTYSLFMSPELVADRIIGLIKAFYIKKLSFMRNWDDVMTARDLILDAFDRFGYERFDELLISRSKIIFWEDIKNKDIDKHIFQTLLDRNAVLNKRVRVLSKKFKSKNSKFKKLLKRRSVKTAIKVSDFLRNLKSKPSQEVSKKNIVDPITAAYQTQLVQFLQETDDESNGYWVFSDRWDAANDNAEALYRYVMNNKLHDKLAFILSKESNDYLRLKREGFNVIEFGSLQHWHLVQNAIYYFVSHCDEFIIKPWYYIGTSAQKRVRKKVSISSQYKLIFLQHGVIRSDLSSWLGNKNIEKFVTSSPIERRSLLSIANYSLCEEQVILTGLPRWDYLVASPNSQTITVFPTWRKILYNSKSDEQGTEIFKGSVFFKNWCNFLNSSELLSLTETHKVQLCLHWNNSFAVEVLRNALDPKIEVYTFSEIESFSNVVNTSQMIITDYSSFSFDFLYLDKPVIYYDFEENALNNNNKDEEYSRFGYYCTNEKEALSALKEIVQNEFVLPEKKLKAINELLPIRDGNHCKRVIDCIK